MLIRLLLFLLVMTQPLRADVRGIEALEFQAAFQLWLDDNEEIALPALAHLAREGNEAARIVVGAVDKTAPLQGPWLALQSKRRRIELLRDEGGLSGTSWLRHVDHEAIVLWLKVLDSKAGIEDALRLAELGEARLTRLALIALEARQTTGYAGFVTDPRFPQSVRYLIWREWQKAGDAGAVSRIVSSLAPGDPQRALLNQSVRRSELQDFLLSADLAIPMKALCSAECPATAGACMEAGFQAIGGYRRYATQGTPLAALISETDFAATPRGRKSTLRRAMTYAFLTEGRLRPIARLDACFAELLLEEGQNF